MKNNLKSLVFLLALSLVFAGCKKDRPQRVQEEKSVLIKTEDQIQDENLTEDFYKLVDEAKKDLSDEEKTFLAKTLKDIGNQDKESLSEVLAGPLKSEVGVDLRVLADKLAPVSYAGPISSIKKITKKDNTFLIITEGEEDSLVILMDREGDKLSKLDIRLESTLAKNKALKKDNQAFVNRSYAIIESLNDDDKSSFKTYVKGLNLSDEKLDEVYKGLRKDLEMAGAPLTDKAEVKVSFAKDLMKNAPFDQNLVDVTLVFTFEKIEKIVYDFIYTEDMRLVSLEVRPNEKED